MSGYGKPPEDRGQDEQRVDTLQSGPTIDLSPLLAEVPEELHELFLLELQKQLSATLEERMHRGCAEGLPPTVEISARGQVAFLRHHLTFWDSDGGEAVRSGVYVTPEEGIAIVAHAIHTLCDTPPDRKPFVCEPEPRTTRQDIERCIAEHRGELQRLAKEELPADLILGFTSKKRNQEREQWLQGEARKIVEEKHGTTVTEHWKRQAERFVNEYVLTDAPQHNVKNLIPIALAEHSEKAQERLIHRIFILKDALQPSRTWKFGITDNTNCPNRAAHTTTVEVQCTNKDTIEIVVRAPDQSLLTKATVLTASPFIFEQYGVEFALHTSASAEEQAAFPPGLRIQSGTQQLTGRQLALDNAIVDWEEM